MDDAKQAGNMQIRVDTPELVKALYRVQGIVDRKAAAPALSHVLLSTLNSGEISVCATDNDIYLVGTCKAEVLQPGKLAISARQLYDIVKAVSADSIVLTGQDNHWLDIEAGNSRFHLVGMSPAEFPELAEVESSAHTVEVAAKTLGQLIDRSLFCVSLDENRHHLSGIYCETVSSKMLRLVATDGHRLALAEGPRIDGPKLETGIIVPRKGLHELKRMLAEAPERNPNVLCSVTAKTCVFTLGGVLLSTRLIEGQFPKYDQVIPKAGTKQVRFNRAAFVEALKRVSLLAQGRAHGVRFSFSPGSVELLAEDPKMGEARETLDIDYQGEPLVIGFNARYILEALALIPEQGVCFDLSDDLSPGVIRPIEDTSFLAVVMPMRI